MKDILYIKDLNMKNVYNENNLKLIKRDNLVSEDNGEFFFLPSRLCMFIGGSSGVGKSTFANKYAKNIQNIKEKDIYFFSDRNPREDPAYKNLEIKGVIEIEDKNEKGEIDLSFLKNSLVICDDFDLDAIVYKKIIIELLELGRKEDIEIIIISHIFTNGKFTSRILNECNCIVYFPLIRNTNLNYYLEKYQGFSKKEIEEYTRNIVRDVCLVVNYPRCMVMKNRIRMIDKINI